LSRLDDNLDNNNKSKENFLKKHANSIVFLLLLTVIVSIITYWRILIQIDMGPVSDSFDFLSNALVFAGHGTGYSDLLRPPFFSFIISLIFTLGYISSSVIFYVDGGLFVFGVIGLFMLLKTRFNDLESFLGGLLYATFPIVLTNLGVGFSDLASVSFTIWTFYFLVLAFKKNSTFFILAFPFAMFAFLTRYNSALIIFPILLYILINKDKVNFKNIIIGITASFLIIIPLLIFNYERFGNIIYPFINFESNSAIVSVSPELVSYIPNIFFFLENFPGYVGFQGSIILLIVVIFVVLYVLLLFIRNHQNKINLFEGLSLKNGLKNIKFIIFVVLVIIFLGSFGKIYYMINELLFFAIAYLFYDLTKNIKFKHLNLNIMFFAWFMTFFIFQSIFVIKDNRYFVLMAPPVAYFMIFGLNELSNRIKINVKSKNITFPLLVIFLITIIFLSTTSYLPLVQQTNNNQSVANEDVKLASQWLTNYDINYKSKIIYADSWPNFSWYLKTNINPMPVFKDNQSFYEAIKDYNFNQQDRNAFNNYLITNNAYYYLSVRQGLNLTSYTPIKQFGYVTIYKRNN